MPPTSTRSTTPTSLRLRRGLRYNPYNHAEALGIEVIHRPIRTSHGMWLPDHNLIVVKSGMRAVHDRTALAHEIAHATLGHDTTTPKIELAADRYASEFLLHPHEVEHAARVTGDLVEMALELQVSQRLLREYLTRHQWAA